MKKISISLILLCSVFSAKSQIPEDSLQLNYIFNTTADDLSGNNFHGFLNSVTVTEDRFMNADKAFKFDGSSSYISVPNMALIKPDFPFTISLWMKIDAFSNVSSVVYASDEVIGVYSGFWIGYLPTGEISAGYGDGLGQNSNHRITKHSGVLLDTNSWHNIIAVYNDLNYIDLYIDCEEHIGNYSGSASGLANLSGSGVVGRNLGHNINSYHNGLIDDIRIYNKSLTASEIDSLCTEPDSKNVGIVDLDQKTAVNIYPNPASDVLNINIPDYNNPIKVELWTITGQKIIIKKINSSNSQLNIEKIPTGYYLLKTFDDIGELLNTTKVLVN